MLSCSKCCLLHSSPASSSCPLYLHTRTSLPRVHHAVSDYLLIPLPPLPSPDRVGEVLEKEGLDGAEWKFLDE